MSNGLRYVVLVLLLAVPAAASAQSAADYNDQGKALWVEQNDLEGAIEKFRQAVALNPEAKYIFNLCYALHQLGKFREALTECEKVESANGVDDKLRKKVRVVIKDLNDQLANLPDDPYAGDPGPGDPDPGDPDPGDPDPGDPDGADPDGAYPDDGGDPGADTGATGTDPAGPGPGIGPRRRPIPGLYQPAEIPDDYKWALGVEVGAQGSNIGFEGGGGAKLRAYIDFMWLPEARIGLQGYLGMIQVQNDDSFDETIQLVDIGGAVFKHIKRGRFYLTPLAGAHLSLIQADVLSEEAVATIGLRADLGVSWLLGSTRRHELSVTPGLSLYLPAGGDENIVTENGLDQTGVSFGITVGYKLRFTTPFGQSSLITLE